MSTVVAILACGVTLGVMKSSLSQILTGQNKMEGALGELTLAVNATATAQAVNVAQHEEMSRRVLALEGCEAKLEEHIRILRTRSHLHAGKLMEIDPGWRPYREEV